MRILLVEDQDELADQVTRRLKREGFAVDVVRTASAARDFLQNETYPLALLDRRLPDGDGLSLIPAVKRAKPGIRILVLTALDAVDERVSGLDAGADDYLTKPFDLDELMARVRAALRRPGAEIAPPTVVGALAFEPATRNVAVRGEPVVFHQRELALIEALMRRAGRIVERETLVTEIWGVEEEVQPHALTIVVSRVRARLEKLEARAEIHMVRGIGYFIAESAAAGVG
jgi:two-component system OmpR family response regulator